MSCWPVSARVGNVKNNDPSLSLARVRLGGSGGPDKAMNWHRWLATLLVMLALAACAQGGQDPYAAYPPHDRGGGGGMM